MAERTAKRTSVRKREVGKTFSESVELLFHSNWDMVYNKPPTIIGLDGILENKQNKSINLDTENLNSVISEGTYRQPYTNKATLTRNYPIERSGNLSVLPFSASSQQVIQIYITSANGPNDGLHVRRYNGSVWTTWMKVVYLPEQANILYDETLEAIKFVFN